MRTEGRAKPCYESAARNRFPIAAALRRHLGAGDTVLELGSGTGQQSVWFAQQLEFASWQTSDLPGRLDDIRAWISEAATARLPEPIALDAVGDDWPAHSFDVIVAVNVCHIIGPERSRRLFSGAAARLNPGGRIAVYGPFFRSGTTTSPGNAAFDRELRRRDPASGLCSLDEIDTQLAVLSIGVAARYAMPSNNFLSVWRRGEEPAS